VNGEISKLVPDLAVYTDTYEPHLIAWLKEWLKTGDTFWDIGANWGFISLPADRKDAGYQIFNHHASCLETLEDDEYLCLPPSRS
jgi:hypothetical protein